MKVLNKSLIVLVIAASFVSACSKDDTSRRIHKSDIVSAEGDKNRFAVYNTIEIAESTPAMNITKATESTPDAPNIPVGAVNMLDVDGKGTPYTAWTAQKGTNYYLPEGAEWSGQIQLNEGMNYFVEGSLALNFYGSKGVVNILPKGTLKITESTTSINGVSIRSWGEFDVESNLTIGFGGSVISYSKSEISAVKMQNQGEFIHYGDLTLSSDLDCSGYKSSFNVYGSVAANFVMVNNSSKALVAGNVVTETGVEVNGYSSLKVGASLVSPNGRVYSTNNSTLDVADYIKCKTLELDSNGNVVTHKETLVVCDNLIYKNNTAKIHNADKEGAYTVIVVKNLEEAWNSIDRMNGGGIDLHTDPSEYEHLDWTANVIFNGSTYIPEKGLRPEYGPRPVDPEPLYTLDHIGSIKSIDKESVSATSIDFVDGLAYFSWHKRGADYDGYIDVADITSRSIVSTLHATTQDFNSINVVGSQICAVGGDAKGAIISNIVYSKSVVSAADYSYVGGASANSVLCVGENKWVTTNSGVTILPENKFISLESAKYATISGDKVVVLAGTPAASLNIFEQDGTLVRSFSCGTISIENGKNTIFADGDRIYVSLGEAGLRSYNLDGTLLSEFAEVGSGAVNGVSADENYIYMACGLSGLYILDKNDFSLIKSYSLNGASANFVKKADDGLIYVAYGLNGVHLFELRVE